MNSQDEKKKKAIERDFKIRKKQLKASPQLKIFEDRYCDFINDLVKKLEPIGSGSTCIATGQHSAKIFLRRDEYPLLGSEQMLNFFSFFEEGLGFSYNAFFAVQFAPLAVIEVSDEATETKRKKKIGPKSRLANRRRAGKKKTTPKMTSVIIQLSTILPCLSMISDSFFFICHRMMGTISPARGTWR